MSGWWAFLPGEEDIAGKKWLHGGAGAVTGLRKKSRGVSLNWGEGMPQGGKLVTVQGGGTRGCHCPRGRGIVLALRGGGAKEQEGCHDPG